jgi:hypothetical protein
MCSFKEHCADCKRNLGDDFVEVNRWLDEMYKYDQGFHHRSYRHHKEGVEEVRQKWGDLAAEAAMVHIRKDFPGLMGEIPDAKDYENPNLIYAADFMVNSGINNGNEIVEDIECPEE